MPTPDSLKQSMERAVKRYSSLFRLPSDRNVLLLLALVSFASGLLSALVLSPPARGLINGTLIGLALFLASFASDYVINASVLKQRTIYNFRRTMALSLFSWIVWLFFISLGVILAFLISSQTWWLRLCFLGFSAATIFRLVVFFSTAALNYAKILASSFLQPLCCVAAFLLLWIDVGNGVSYYIPAFFILSVVVGFASTLVFVHFLDRVGKKTLGMRSLELFRAFMLNWVMSLNEPFEQLLEKLGEKRNVEACLLKFTSTNGRIIMTVPSVHPGPFKNIGSSLLPSLLKSALEKIPNCVACVPHGLLGHEFDLASQQQNQRVISEVVESAKDLGILQAKASPFVKVTNGLATACCQVFGKSAVISFTLAPKTIEDLPEELGVFVREEAVRRDLDLCVVINAHNSIDGTSVMQESLESLRNVARKCLEKATSMEQGPFEVGAAVALPKEFSLEDGMGPGGVTVVAVKCGMQKAAYVVIDGNNMVSGLREQVLSSLKSIDIEEGEVFTTDTHAVSALVLGGQGYHPVGDVIEGPRLIRYIKEATRAAVANLDSARVSCESTTVKDVTVLGAKQLETLCLLIDQTLQTAKRTVVPVFVGAGLLLMSFLLLV